MQTEYLRAGFSPAFTPPASGDIGVDLENRVIRGLIAAEAGDFKTGRGTFDQQSLAAIARLINDEPDGVVVNYGHSDAVGGVGSAASLDAFLGRAKNARIDGNRVRVDLHLSPVAFMGADGASLGQRVMQRAKLDPRSFATSLVLTADKLPSRNGSPPIWRPQQIQSLDVVRVGDAVHSGALAASLSATSPRQTLYLLAPGRDSNPFVTGPTDPRHAKLSNAETDELRLRWRNMKRKLLTA